MHSPQIDSPGSKIQHRFTLIELLVVVAIIAVLASMLLPALTQARTKARVTVCLSQKKEVGMATIMFTGDHDNHIPNMGASRPVYAATLWSSARWHGENNPQNADPVNRYYPMGQLYIDGYASDGKLFYCTDGDIIRTNATSQKITYQATWFNGTTPRVEHPTDTARFWTSVLWIGAWYYEERVTFRTKMPFDQGRNIGWHEPADPLVVDTFFLFRNAGQYDPPIPHGGTGVTRVAFDGHADFLRNPVQPQPRGTPTGYTYSGHPWNTEGENEGMYDRDVIRRLE